VRTLAGVGIAGAASLLVSVAALIPGAVFVHAAAVLTLLTATRERDATSAPRLRGALYGCALFDFVAFGVLSFGLRSQSRSTIFDYWQKGYLPLDSFHAAREFLASKGVVVFADAVPGMPPRATMLLAAIGWAALVVRRPTRTAGMCIGAVFLALFAASALQYYPAGGVRTDLFTHPLTALLAATAIHTMASTRRPVGRIARPLLIVIVGAGALFASSVATYPRAGDREVIEHAAATLGDDETVFIYPWTNWAVALYGRWPVRLEAEPVSTNGFYAIPVRANTMVLRERRGDMSFRTTADVARPQIEGYLANERPARVHLIATRVEEHALAYIRDAIEERGYRRTETFERYRATFDTFERHVPLEAVARREALTPGEGGARSRPIVE
jgi:hypothetical protein